MPVMSKESEGGRERLEKPQGRRDGEKEKSDEGKPEEMSYGSIFRFLLKDMIPHRTWIMWLILVVTLKIAGDKSVPCS